MKLGSIHKKPYPLSPFLFASYTTGTLETKKTDSYALAISLS